ncbi:MAG TPA: isoamylase early set domain-containing protein [Gemmatimonadaceae bacterium]|nr:isoamylase early set domain-containing protein [Gemmatimonadaceae bacterium]
MTRLTTDDLIVDATVARAAHALRAEVPVREAWRAALLDELARERRDGAPAPAPRRLVLRPGAAIAAALLLAVAGAVGGAAMMRARLAATATAPQLVDRSGAVPAPRAALAGQPTARFVIVVPGARQVALVGDFNLWDARATPMRPLGDGRTWLAELPLRPGRHAYAFVVDGTVAVDPGAPRAAEDDFGRPNSVMVVSGPTS